MTRWPERTKPRNTWPAFDPRGGKKGLRQCFLILLALEEQEIERRAIIEDSRYGIRVFEREILITKAKGRDSIVERRLTLN